MRKPTSYFAKQEFTFRPPVIEFTDMRVNMDEIAVETAKFSITQYLKGDLKNSSRLLR
jgi:hypothetical protein